MPVLISKCTVCGSKFEGYLISSSPYPFYQKYKAFCQHLLNDNFKVPWDSCVEPFPFCDTCKIKVDHLFTFHEQHENIHYEINSLVSTLSSTILNSLNNNDDNSYDESTFPNKRKGSIFVDKGVLNKINTLRQAIRKSYDPKVVLLDCQSQRKLRQRLDISVLNVSNEQNNFVEEERDDDLESLKKEPTSPTSDFEGQHSDFSDRDEPSHFNRNVEESRSRKRKEITRVTGLSMTLREKPKKKRKYEFPLKPVTPSKKLVVKKTAKKKIEEKPPEEKQLLDDDDDDWNNEDEEAEESADEDWIVAETKKQTNLFKSSDNPVMTDYLQLPIIYLEDEGILQYGTWKFEKEEEDDRFKCLECGVGSLWRANIPKHVKATHILNIEKIEREKAFTVNEEGKYHFLTWTFEKLDGEDKYKCDVCGTMASNPNSMVSHINSIHNDDSLSCWTCGRTWRTIKGMQKHKCHINRHVNLKCVYIGDGKYMYDGKWPYEAAHPDPGQSGIVDKRLGVPNVGFKCGTCGIHKTTVSCTIMHIRKIHMGIRPFVCETCGHAAVNGTLFRAHQATHSSERPYVCEVCGKAFKTSSVLRSHTLTHGEKKYTCDQCGRKYQGPSSLLRHRRAANHFPFETSNNEPVLSNEFDCPRCKKRCQGKIGLSLHLARGKCVFKPKEFPCRLCSFVDDDRRYLVKHMELIHNITNFQFQRRVKSRKKIFEKSQTKEKDVDGVELSNVDSTIVPAPDPELFCELTSVTEKLDESLEHDFSVSDDTLIVQLS